MTAPILRQSVIVTNPQGFHMRPAAAFAKLARQYQCDVRVIKEDQPVDGKSVLELMGLAAEPGTELIIEVCGADAGDALALLVEIVNALPDDPDQRSVG